MVLVEAEIRAQLAGEQPLVVLHEVGFIQRMRTDGEERVGSLAPICERHTERGGHAVERQVAVEDEFRGQIRVGRTARHHGQPFEARVQLRLVAQVGQVEARREARTILA